VEPGESATTKIFVFNIHGNRPTHVRAGVAKTPPGFTIEILPEPETIEYNVSGVIMSSDENFVVDPVDRTTLPQQKPETAEEGTEWITMGGVEGFVPAKVLLVKVTADEALPLWEDYELKVAATANWFDLKETGPVSVGQAREFSYTVRTVTTQYSEEKVPSPTPSPTPSPQATAPVQQEILQEENLWFYATIGLAVLVVLLLAYAFLVRPSRR
jgi:hypothetical protein